jgi:hypothetical protein
MHPRDAFKNLQQALDDLNESGAKIHDVAYYEASEDVVGRLLDSSPQPVVHILKVPGTGNLVVSWEDK